MGKKILDNLTGKKVSRQRLWQLRNQRRGLCCFCQAPLAANSKSCCVEHMIAKRERQRKAVGCKLRFLGAKSYQYKEKK